MGAVTGITTVTGMPESQFKEEKYMTAAIGRHGREADVRELEDRGSRPSNSWPDLPRSIAALFNIL